MAAGTPIADRAERDDLRAGLALLALFAGLYLAHASIFSRYENDDAFITFRYSRFLALGRGPYYNVGEHVEGYTNFLTMVLLAPVARLVPDGPDLLVAAQALSLGCALAAMGVAFATARSLLAPAPGARGPLAGALAAGMLALSPGYAVNGMSGLETTLFGLCLSAGALLAAAGAERGRWRGAGAAFALAALARPEGALLFAVHWTAQALVTAERRRVSGGPWTVERQLLLDGCLVTATVIAHHAFRWWAYDGELVPNTYHAKMGGALNEATWSYVRNGAYAPFLGAAAAALGIAGVMLRREVRERALPLVATAVFGSLLPFVTGTDFMAGWRLLVPYLPMLAAAVAAGWSVLALAAGPRASRVAAVALFGVLPFLWLRQEPGRYAIFHELAGMDDWTYFEVGEAVRDLTEPGDVVALMDIGRIGYEAIDRTILDITGLTDRFIAKSPGTFLAKVYDPRYVLDRRPDVVVLRFYFRKSSDGSGFWTHYVDEERRLYDHPEFERLYRRVRPPPPHRTGWTDRLAGMLGAARVYAFTFPPRYEVLAVFVRRSEP